ncbi:hypothetical protein [Nocardioides nanhaiensis]|uniref:Twin-arginine translocation signal domain-containing protein n=1 Tax=Nocardioides nanhaiensis TaxID=1476871 RepID=A0ABP8WGL1_9ACTN
MSETSRRGFIAVAGAGAAAGAVAATAGAAAASDTERGSGLGSGGPVMVYIENPAAGRLTVMSGDDEVDVTDKDLVGRILRAAGVR